MTGAMLATRGRVTGAASKPGRSHSGGRHRKPPAPRKTSAAQGFSGDAVLHVVIVAVLVVALAFVGMITNRSTGEPIAGADHPPAPSQGAPLHTPDAQPPRQPSPARFLSDDQGYVESSARCGGTQPAFAIGRTAGSLVVICAERAGQYEYLGVRLSDQAVLRTSAETDSARGFLAQRGGVVYALSPTELKVTAGSTVIKREPMIEYRLVSRSRKAESAGP